MGLRSAGKYKPAKWPLGFCHERDAECKKLGVTDNLCGKCTALSGGGFRLEEPKMGLRFGGASFDDNQIGKGSYQAMNICSLAKYGNLGKITHKPLNTCAGTTGTTEKKLRWKAELYQWSGHIHRLPSLSGRSPKRVVHNMALINQNGWSFRRLGFYRNFVVKYSGQMRIRKGGVYTFRTCSDDGSNLFLDGAKVVDNDGLHGTRCREGRRTLNAGLHDIAVNFFQAGGGARIYVWYKGPDRSNRWWYWLTLAGPPARRPAARPHWYGNCRKGSNKQEKCCTNAALLQNGFDWNKFSRGNSCWGDKVCPCRKPVSGLRAHAHARTHARTHARARAHTHAHNTHTQDRDRTLVRVDCFFSSKASLSTAAVPMLAAQAHEEAPAALRGREAGAGSAGRVEVIAPRVEETQE